VWILENWSKLHIRSYEIKSFSDYNFPREVTTRMILHTICINLLPIRLLLAAFKVSHQIRKIWVVARLITVVYLYMKICLKATMVYFGRNSSNHLTTNKGKGVCMCVRLWKYFHASANRCFACIWVHVRN